MKKKNLLFTKVLLAVAMTIMVLGVNKQTVKAITVYNSETGEYEDVSEEELYKDTINGDPNKVHIHKYAEMIEPSTYDYELGEYALVDGYYYTKCVNFDGGICDEGHEIIKGDTIYAPKKITLSKTTYYYNGKERKPSVTVYDRKGNVIDSSNYTVEYYSNTKVGNATVNVIFDGKRYSGSLSKNFTIKAKAPKKAPTIKKMSLNICSDGEATLQLTVSKVKGVRGFYYQVASDKKFKNIIFKFYQPYTNVANIKTKVICYGTKTGTLNIGYLKKNKTYYVRVSSYILVPSTAKEDIQWDLSDFINKDYSDYFAPTVIPDPYAWNEEMVLSKWSAVKTFKAKY
jgi:uncharacterized protein (DUF427 family)